MTCALIKQFIDGHNEKRRMLARGIDKTQPMAALMYHMVGDELFSTLLQTLGCQALPDVYCTSQTIPGPAEVLIIRFSNNEENNKTLKTEVL